MSEKRKLAFNKTNYLLMIGGLVVLVIGFIIMTMDSEQHGFGFLGLTLGPIVVMLGFLVQFIAIMYKAKTTDSDKE